MTEYAHLFFDGDTWKLHAYEHAHGKTGFYGDWKNSVLALNELAAQAWTVADVFVRKDPDTDGNPETEEYLLKREAQSTKNSMMPGEDSSMG